MEKELEQVTKRVDKLEAYRDEDLSKINDNSKSTEVILAKLNNLDSNIGLLIKSVEDNMKFNNEMQIKENQKMNSRINELENKYDELKKIVDDRTIVKESNRYNDVVKQIVTAIVGAIMGIVIAKLFK